VNSDGTKTLEAAGEVLQQGSPMSAERFNHMEDGIAGAHSAVSDLSAAMGTALGGKQDKEEGKGLSSNDFTDSYKSKLDNVDTTVTEDSEHLVTSGAVFAALAGASGEDINALKNMVYPKLAVKGEANTSFTLTKDAKSIEGIVGEGGSTDMLIPELGTWTVSWSGNTKTVDIVAPMTFNEVELVILTQWQVIQRAVRNGTASSLYPVGTQLEVTKGESTLVFDVVAHDIATPADTSKSHSMTLVLHDLLPDYMMFDNKEPNNSDSNRQNYGNNRYSVSNIRQWLNSSGAAGSWYTDQHAADAAPDYAATTAGFMSDIDSDFLEVIGKTKIRTAKNTVTDGGGYEDLSDEYFYLLSKTEVGLGNENNIAEGVQFPYFSDNDKRKKAKTGDSNYYWWLRTPNSGYSYSVRRVDTSGTLYYDNACYSNGVAPACNII
jgi:hypothetical protein